MNCKHLSTVLYAVPAFFMLLFCFYQSGFQSFWLDEMSLLGTITKDKSLADILNQYLTIDVTNLPLFPLAAALWYRIFPAIDRIMLLLPAISVFFSVLFTARLSEHCFGRAAGAAAAILTSSSSFIILKCCFEFRSYAFMLLFSASSLYYHALYKDRFLSVQKEALSNSSSSDNKASKFGFRALFSDFTNPYFTAFTLSLFFLAFSHYMGVLLILGLGICDFFLYLYNEQSKKNILKKTSILKKLLSSFKPYFVNAVMFLVWFALMLQNKTKSISSFWPDPPTLPKITRSLRAMLSGNEAIFIMMIISFLIMLSHIFTSLSGKSSIPKKVLHALTLSFSGLFVLGSVFIYSVKINPSGGFFVTRYFTVILPCMIGLISFGISEAINFFTDNKTRERRLRLIFVCLGLLITYYFPANYRKVREESGKSTETFREAASWIKSNAKDDLYEDNTAVICSVNPRATAGFIEYYLREGGRTPNVNFISLQSEEPLKDLPKYDEIYLVTVHREMSKFDDEIQSAIFDNYELKDSNEDIKAYFYKKKG